MAAAAPLITIVVKNAILDPGRRLDLQVQAP